MSSSLLGDYYYRFYYYSVTVDIDMALYYGFNTLLMCCDILAIIVHDHFALCQYLLTSSMVQSPSLEANWFAASQEIPRISRNPKLHYRTHKRPPPVSILGQPNPVQYTHIPPPGDPS